MKTIFSTLDNRSSKPIWRISISLALVLSALYIAVGNVVTLEPFFAIPVIIASWYGSNKSGISLSVISTTLLISINVLFFNTTLDVNLLATYGLTHLIAYSTMAILITNFRAVHRVEEDAADTDYLTGIHNTRSFYIELSNELTRSQRYKRVFSLAYMDVDNFKHINDTLGHEVGDKLLIEVAHCLESNLRKIDTVARMGGDEYACLLPETEQESAKKAFHKIQKLLHQQMEEHDWPVTFSIGVVTFEQIPDDIKLVMKTADDLMYSVKNTEKDNIAYKAWP